MMVAPEIEAGRVSVSAYSPQVLAWPLVGRRWVPSSSGAVWMLLERHAEPRRSPAPLPAQPDHEDVLNRTLAALSITRNTP